MLSWVAAQQEVLLILIIVIYPQWFSDGGGNGLKSHLNKLTLSVPNNFTVGEVSS